MGVSVSNLAAMEVKWQKDRLVWISKQKIVELGQCPSDKMLHRAVLVKNTHSALKNRRLWSLVSARLIRCSTGQCWSKTPIPLLQLGKERRTRGEVLLHSPSDNPKQKIVELSTSVLQIRCSTERCWSGTPIPLLQLGKERREKGEVLMPSASDEMLLS